ncbi:hypothetical protein [Neopusillimonas maritima]|uniref:Uncharacterized protein n=1 Tax=Neopusillimonas maritima TaxID=2026239 RepID=A0A3A1YYE8_9BURK|nr:hypothetical protein [Neopusillimonas maritima]RIY41117.1 hypothetical protein CJP73_08185 [Neopusillimonas maritima]|tara:strand:+ start:7882 stop:8859 length:978 start_codon:yes stop_codon:yes gene_type:complete
MIGKIFIEGDYLEIYPYMNWLFLLNHEGDLLVSRTEQLIDDSVLHDYFFRQGKNIVSPPPRETVVSIDPRKFKKIAKIADQYSFSDLRFFYSNILCGSNDGLQFLAFDTATETITKEMKVTDTPISSIAARYMTVFAASLEDSVTTLFGVKAGEYAHIRKTGSQASRVGVSFKRIHFYAGAVDLHVSTYERSPVEADVGDEKDREEINRIDEARPYAFGQEVPDFVFNSNNGIYLKFGAELRYRKDDSLEPFIFPLGNSGKLISAHLHMGATTFEFLDGLFCRIKNSWMPLLEGECISTRGYSNSVNYQKTVTAVNERGAHYFVL